MDNQRLVYSGRCLFWFQYKLFRLRAGVFSLLALAHTFAIAGVVAPLHADSSENFSKINLRALQPYIAHSPDEFNDSIPFQWRYLPTITTAPSSLGSNWRHSYDFKLLQNEGKLELLNPDGTRQLYLPIDTNTYVADQKPERTIQHKQQHYYLVTPEESITFFGSYPVLTKARDRSAIHLRYKNGQLHRLFDKLGNSLDFSYAENGALRSIKQTDGAFIHFNYDQHNRLASSQSLGSTNQYVYPTSPPVVLCTASTPHTQQQVEPQQQSDAACDAKNNPPPHSFQLSQPSRHALKIDLRPQSCRSYFVDYNGIDRGVKLEAGMLRHSRYSNLLPTVRSFPVVDFIDGREAVAVYTKDLTSKTYNPISHPDGLYKSILQDAHNIDDKFLSKLQTLGSVSAKEKGETTTIRQSQVDTLRMEIMIQAGVATPTQLAQIERARLSLMARWNIKLLVVHIP